MAMRLATTTTREPLTLVRMRLLSSAKPPVLCQRQKTPPHCTALHCTALTQNPFDQSNEPDNHQETRPATVDPRPTPCRPRSDPHRHLHPRAAQDSTQPHSILTSSAAQPPPKAKPATYDLRRPWLAADAVSTAQSWGGKRRGRMESQARLLCCWPGLSAGAQERWFGIRAGERGGENRAWHCRGDGDGDRGEREQRPRDIHRSCHQIVVSPACQIHHRSCELVLVLFLCKPSQRRRDQSPTEKKQPEVKAKVRPQTGLNPPIPDKGPQPLTRVPSTSKVQTEEQEEPHEVRV